MMRDERALRRQWILLCALSAHRYGLTIQDMVAESGVARANETIRRDLDLFRKLGFPLERPSASTAARPGSSCPTAGRLHLALARSNPDEAIALHPSAAASSPPSEGTPIGEAADHAFRKSAPHVPQIGPGVSREVRDVLPHQQLRTRRLTPTKAT